MKTRTNAAFALELKALRASRGISQPKMAEIIDADHSYVSRLETGNRQPSREMVNRIIVDLKLNPDERRRLLSAAFLPDDLVAVSGNPPGAMRAEFV